ncbi:PAC2 family protein [Halobium salinum]|uniref:PAC2 family protein n=1 Tax=Halobium salinum TaxID=1364940 RepID=A0ABD5PCD7_9EURY|nr:PAC2 family protein [Halobium salinum]
MESIEIDEIADPELDEPVLVEGLPGVGHVGKLAAEYLLEEFESELVRRVYADEFPPQVSIDDEGVAELTCAEFHAVHLTAEDGADGADDGDDEDEADGEGDTESQDLLVLTGDHQAQSNAGHYHVTDAFLDVAESFGVERAFALGGVPTGELIEDEEYTVLGAVTDAAMKEELEAAGVEFREDEPAGGIVGVSGLVLGLGERRGLKAACLMGETSGYLVDPKSARAVLEVLQERLGFEVDYESLEERAEEMEEVVSKIQEMQGGDEGMPTGDDLRYIG